MLAMPQIVRSFAFALLVVLSWLYLQPALAMSRIKDLASVEGVRENQLVGYGLVVGLNGTGDTLNNSPFTRQSAQAMLERLGLNTRGANMRTANMAAVIVTANLAPFSTQGTRLDITSRRWATRSRCRAGRCSSRRCWAPTARSMPWRKAP